MAPDGVQFAAGVPTNGVVFGQFNSRSSSGVGSLRLGDGQLTTIAPYRANTSGLYAIAVELPWVVWTQGESNTNFNDWTVRAWDQRTGIVAQLATSQRSDGSFVSGQPPTPAIVNGMAAWAQPVASPGAPIDNELRVRTLATGREVMLAHGTVSSPVFALDRLIWGRKSADGTFSFEAADPATMQLTALPSGLSEPGAIGSLAGSPTRLAWSSDALQEATVYDRGTNRRTVYRSPDINHYMQFLQLSAHYLLSYGGVTSTVIDLDTAGGFDVHGTVSGSDQTLVIEEPSRPASGKGDFVASRLTTFPTAALPPIPRCG